MPLANEKPRAAVVYGDAGRPLPGVASGAYAERSVFLVHTASGHTIGLVAWSEADAQLQARRLTGIDDDTVKVWKPGPVVALPARASRLIGARHA